MPGLNMDFNMNMNMDFNMNMAAPGSSVGGNTTRVRFNTTDYRKYLAMSGTTITDTLVLINPQNMRFPAHWDADLKAYLFLDEFLINFQTWQSDVETGLGATVLTPPHKLTPTTAIKTQLEQMLASSADRDDRMAEILGQHSGEGAIGYFLGMLMIDPARMPATNLLIRVARRIGEHVSMCMKAKYQCPRPSQLCTAIVPLLDPPATPSFPSGHSLQAQLIAKCLAGTTPVPPTQPAHLVDKLATRIGENRIIAGLHYPKDHEAGQAVANFVYTSLLKTLPSTSKFQKLQVAAGDELKQTTDDPVMA
jgi:acid phosphatase (class A)